MGSKNGKHDDNQYQKGIHFYACSCAPLCPHSKHPRFRPLTAAPDAGSSCHSLVLAGSGPKPSRPPQVRLRAWPAD